jgi:beta-glucanase (GH16 family)
VIEAHHERWRNRDFTSARLVTREKQHWQYGRFEICARLPRGRGTWPAFWLLPAKTGRRWPDDGEIDLMEHVGHLPGLIHGTIHTAARNHRQGNPAGKSISIADAHDRFHQYSMEWSADRITWLVDGQAYFEYQRTPGMSYDEWPFDAPFYLVLNLAVGGDWGGTDGVDLSAFPAQLVIDYVRVYQYVGRSGRLAQHHDAVRVEPEPLTDLHPSAAQQVDTADAGRHLDRLGPVIE